AERLGGPELDLEDLVHDVFVIAQRRLPSFRGDSQIGTWLYGITVRVVKHRRRALRWRRLFRAPAPSRSEEVPDDRPTAVEELQRRQATAQLHELLDQLQERYRTAVILHELEGMPCQAIAD